MLVSPKGAGWVGRGAGRGAETRNCQEGGVGEEAPGPQWSALWNQASTRGGDSRPPGWGTRGFLVAGGCTEHLLLNTRCPVFPLQYFAFKRQILARLHLHRD